jgi:hypothetical protein
MSERQVSNLEIESALIGLLGAEHPACLSWADSRREWEEILASEKALNPGLSVVDEMGSSWSANSQFEKVIRTFVRTLPVKLRIELAMTMIGEEHDIELHMNHWI